jgi:hypothetical protein
MTAPKPPAKKSASRVDWSNPRLEALLKKTEGWQLDNRGSYPPQDVGVQIGWSGDTGVGTAESSRPGVLVWEHEQVMVLETSFPIEQGELVRIDRLVGERVEAAWGSLIESRPGLRSEDDENHVHVHWINMR